MDGKHFLGGLSLAPAPSQSTTSLDFGFELAHPSGRHSHGHPAQQRHKVLAPTREALVEHNLRTNVEPGGESGQQKVKQQERLKQFLARLKKTDLIPARL